MTSAVMNIPDYSFGRARGRFIRLPKLSRSPLGRPIAAEEALDLRAWISFIAESQGTTLSTYACPRLYGVFLR
jgi:hypothetical protein